MERTLLARVVVVPPLEAVGQEELVTDGAHRDDRDLARDEAVQVDLGVLDRAELLEDRAVEAARDVHLDVVQERHRPAAVHLEKCVRNRDE